MYRVDKSKFNQPVLGFQFPTPVNVHDVVVNPSVSEELTDSILLLEPCISLIFA
jgi:hypothetical protein